MILATLLTLAGTVTVQLPADAKARGTSINLGEIAHVSGADEALVAKVAAFELGNVPAPGYNRVFQAAQLERDLVHAMPGLDVRFAGASLARVQPAVQIIGKDSLRAAALKVLEERFLGKDVEITVKDELSDLRVPMGEQSTVLEGVVKQNGHRPGLWSVPVNVLVDGVRYQTVWTTWEVGLWERRQVLARPIGRGETVSSDAFELKRVKVDVYTAESGLPAKALIGASASRDLAVGAVVTQRDVERPIIVRRGDTVHLAVRKGPITASATAVASQDGRAGDNIRVRTIATNREISATVVARDVVEIVLGSRNDQ